MYTHNTHTHNTNIGHFQTLLRTAKVTPSSHPIPSPPGGLTVTGAEEAHSPLLPSLPLPPLPAGGPDSDGFGGGPPHPARTGQVAAALGHFLVCP